jgi:hypothetical protein
MVEDTPLDPNDAGTNASGREVLDYNKWFAFDAFTIDELVCLGAGVDPNSAPPWPPDVEFRTRSVEIEPEECWPAGAVSACVQLAKLFNRSLRGGRLKELGFDATTQNIPRDVAFAFLADSGCCSPTFLSAYEDWTQRKLEIGNAKTRSRPEAQNQEREVHPRVQKTLLKMIYGMAKSKYRYNPSGTRNSAVTNITGDITGAGLKVDEDTVRKWLNAAADVAKEESD